MSKPLKIKMMFVNYLLLLKLISVESRYEIYIHTSINTFAVQNLVR